MPPVELAGGIALAPAEAGVHVLIHARQNHRGAEEVAAMARARGVEAHIVLADLSQIDALDSFAEEAWKWRDVVDVLVNAAGADTLTGEAVQWPFVQKLGNTMVRRRCRDGDAHAFDWLADESSR